MMAAPLVFPSEWRVQINKMLKNDDNPLPNTPAILRVPTRLLKMKPEAYIPHFLSFGPYHHSKLEKDIDSDSPCAERKISMAEAYKGKFAAMLSKELHRRGKRFELIVEMMEQMRPEIESFYRWPTSTDGEYSKNFALMMAIDSSFLLQFFIIMHHFGRSTLRLDDEIDSFINIYFNCIRHDIEKMENQIPLFVLKEVFDYVKEALRVDESLKFNHLLEKMCYSFPPFQYQFIYLGIAENEPNIPIDAMANEPHFLGCLHKSLSLVLDMQPGGEVQPGGEGGEEQPGGEVQPGGEGGEEQPGGEGGEEQPGGEVQPGGEEQPGGEVQPGGEGGEEQPGGEVQPGGVVKWIRSFLATTPRTKLLSPNGMSAVHLARAGIKFKPFSKMPNYIRLDKESGTLYLPHIIVGDIGTEVWLRNMLALEFNDALRPKYVTRYVELMGTLVQSPHDVRLLVDRQLISRS